MTDPTRSDPLPETPGPDVRVAHPLANTVQTYAGGFAAIAGNLAAANQGFGVNLDNLVGIIPLGGQWSDEKLGDTTATPNVENNVNGAGRILKRVTVTGVTDNATDLGKVVFFDSAGPPLLLADPGNTLPFGWILDVVDGANDLCDVWQFGLEALAIFGIMSRVVYGASAWTSWGTDVGNP